jgi:hypothetical protein
MNGPIHGSGSFRDVRKLVILITDTTELEI